MGSLDALLIEEINPSNHVTVAAAISVYAHCILHSPAPFH